MYTIPTFGKRNPIERKQMIPRRTWQDTETVDPFSIGNNVLETARGLATSYFSSTPAAVPRAFPRNICISCATFLHFGDRCKSKGFPQQCARAEGVALSRGRTLSRNPFIPPALAFALCHASVSRHNVSAISLPNSLVIRYSHCRSLASRGIGRLRGPQSGGGAACMPPRIKTHDCFTALPPSVLLTLFSARVVSEKHTETGKHSSRGN
jgi:hypothetical protein